MLTEVYSGLKIILTPEDSYLNCQFHWECLRDFEDGCYHFQRMLVILIFAVVLEIGIVNLQRVLFFMQILRVFLFQLHNLKCTFSPSAWQS